MFNEGEYDSGPSGVQNYLQRVCCLTNQEKKAGRGIKQARCKRQASNDQQLLKKAVCTGWETQAPDSEPAAS
jgi:hypothetical protein